MKDKDMEHFDLRGIPNNWIRGMKKAFASYPKECLPSGICDMAYMINCIRSEVE